MSEARVGQTLTRKFPMTRVVMMMAMQRGTPFTRIQSNRVSIHSPHRIRNTIMNEWKKSVKFHLGTSAYSPLLFRRNINDFSNFSFMQFRSQLMFF